MRVKSSIRLPSPTAIISGRSSRAPAKIVTSGPTDRSVARNAGSFIMRSGRRFERGGQLEGALERVADLIDLGVRHLVEERRVEDVRGGVLGGGQLEAGPRRVLGDWLPVCRDRVQR